MTDYLRYILTVIGIGYLITQSSLMQPIRESITRFHDKKRWWITDKFNGVINCIYCASFWIGLIVFYFMYWRIDHWMLFYAFSCMGAIYVIKNLFSKE